ncbi:MAG TPA: DUF1810 domain-containing protein [Solirubrobacteraceae bacterium]
MSDPFDLRRFEEAQESGAGYAAAAAELRAGRKRSHWMWFVFPQIEGLGTSAMSRRFAIGSAAEARAYLEHPLLGPRLIECAAILLGLSGSTAREIFGAIDALKLRSCMTLFARAAADGEPFRRVLEHYFDGVGDAATDSRLEHDRLRARSST